MKNWIVITGAGSGVGRALAMHFASLESNTLSILGIGRSEDKLRETQNIISEKFPSKPKINICPADVGTEEGRDEIARAIPSDERVKILVNNAAVLGIGKLEHLKLKDFEYGMAVNLYGPLFLSLKLLGKMVEGSRILNISSGLAHRPIAGGGLYCISKAALHMSYKMMSLEFKEKQIYVGSARPGIVATPMQESLRSQSLEDFPSQRTFQGFFENGNLDDPQHTAKFLTFVLLDTHDEEFIKDEWNVADEVHWNRWKN